MLYLACWKKPESWFGWGIKLFTGWAKYTHVELIVSDENGRHWISSETGTGVRVTQDISGNPEKWDIYEMPTVDQINQGVILFTGMNIAEQDGGYDWYGVIFSQLFPFEKQSSDKWFCSELCAHLLQAVDAMPKDRAPANYSPIGLYDYLKKRGSLGQQVFFG